MSENTTPERKKLYSTADIARLLSIDTSTVKRWADSGRLQCYKTIGGHRRFSTQQIQEFISTYHLEGIAAASPALRENLPGEFGSERLAG